MSPAREPWQPGGFLERIGAALVAPRRALACTDAPGSAGRSGNDAALLLALSFVATHTRELVMGAWVGATESARVGLGVILSSLSGAVSMDLAFLFVSALVLWVAAGKRRALGRDFDLACVAFVPFVVVKLAASLALLLTGAAAGPGIDRVVGVLAYGWAVGVLYLAWRRARSRSHQGSEPGAGPEPGPEAAPSTGGRARAAGLVVVAVATVTLVINSVWIARHLDTLRPVTTGDPAPLFTVPAVDPSGALGPGRVSLAEARGQVVLVDFWATWCGPCRDTLPAIERVYQRYRDQGLQVISINTDDPAKARAMMSSLELSMPLYFDHGAVSSQYRVATIPHLVLIDRRGMVRHVHRGATGEDELAAQVRALLAAR